MTVEEFFEQNPMAPEVLRVGADLYLGSAIGAANTHASRIKQEVEVIKNPSMEDGPDDVDDSGPDDQYEEPEEPEENTSDAPEPPSVTAATYGAKPSKRK